MSKKNKFWIIPLLILITISCSQDKTEMIISEDDPTTDIKPLSITNSILKLVNKHRENIGKATLKRNIEADNLAKEHTIYMISKQKISHDNFNSRFQKLQQLVQATSAGENVASGYISAESVMNAWLNSSGHKANIEGNYTHIGISAEKNAKGKYYYTQLFYR